VSKEGGGRKYLRKGNNKNMRTQNKRNPSSKNSGAKPKSCVPKSPCLISRESAIVTGGIITK